MAVGISKVTNSEFFNYFSLGAVVDKNWKKIEFWGQFSNSSSPFCSDVRGWKSVNVALSNANGHITLNTPVLVRSLKLSNVESSQYLDGWPPGNTGCCWLLTFYSFLANFSMKESAIFGRKSVDFSKSLMGKWADPCDTAIQGFPRKWIKMDGEKWVKRTKKRSQQHPVFPGGHPSKYWLDSTLLNFSDRTRTGVFNVIWPLASTRRKCSLYQWILTQNQPWKSCSSCVTSSRRNWMKLQ